MSGGILAAASGLKAQMDALDVLANNMANLNTAGFKEQKAFFSILSEALDDDDRDEPMSSVDAPIQAGASLNMVDGVMQGTDRDLDIALTGDGFLTINTPSGLRYTRNGSLSLNSRSELATPDGLSVMGDGGPILLGSGKVNITAQGDVFLDGNKVGRLKIVSFDKPGLLQREGNSLLAVPASGVKTIAGTAQVKQGYLEISNVNPVASVVEMVGIMRRFEAIQKSISLLSNNLDAKAIEKLGR